MKETYEIGGKKYDVLEDSGLVIRLVDKKDHRDAGMRAGMEKGERKKLILVARTADTTINDAIDEIVALYQKRIDKIEKFYDSTSSGFGWTGYNTVKCAAQRGAMTNEMYFTHTGLHACDGVAGGLFSNEKEPVIAGLDEKAAYAVTENMMAFQDLFCGKDGADTMDRAKGSEKTLKEHFKGAINAGDVKVAEKVEQALTYYQGFLKQTVDDGKAFVEYLKSLKSDRKE